MAVVRGRAEAVQLLPAPFLDQIRKKYRQDLKRKKIFVMSCLVTQRDKIGFDPFSRNFKNSVFLRRCVVADNDPNINLNCHLRTFDSNVIMVHG